MHLATENRLERMLRLTAEDRANYKHCLATLLDSEVFFSAPFVGANLENLIGQDGRFRINMRRTKEGIRVANFYSSLKKLQESEPDAYRYLGMPGWSYIQHNQGRGLALDSDHPYGLNLNSDDTWRLQFFNYKSYLAEVAEKEEQQNRECEDRGSNSATILDFTAALINKNR